MTDIVNIPCKIVFANGIPVGTLLRGTTSQVVDFLCEEYANHYDNFFGQGALRQVAEADVVSALEALCDMEISVQDSLCALRVEDWESINNRSKA